MTVRSDTLANNAADTVTGLKNVRRTFATALSTVSSGANSTNGITSYCRGICDFRAMLERDYHKTLAETISEIKAGKIDIYQLLDNFSDYSIIDKKDMPRTTIASMQAARKLLKFAGLKIHKDEFKDKVTMPKTKSMRDDYSDNQTVQKILNAGESVKVRAFLHTMLDAGLEPIDTIQLKPKYIKFNETPVRVCFDRGKTSEPVETAISKTTADALQQIIAFENTGADDFIFMTTDKGSAWAYRYIAKTSRLAIARAGYGKVVKANKCYYAVVDKIDGHKFGKFHLKVLKKRWFSTAIRIAPEYVVQGMLGRKKYLAEYNRQPLNIKQEYMRKILRAVSIYNNELDDQEKRQQIADVLGLGELTAEQMAKVKSVFFRMLNEPETANKLLGGESA